MTLRYVGRDPDSDFSVLTTKYVKDRYDTIKVDNAYILGEVGNQATQLVTPAYVDQQDALRAKKINVDAADALYIPTSQVGAANGVAPLDNNTMIAPANLPTVQTERKVGYAQGTAIISGDQLITSISAKAYKAGTLTVNDPGYPYYPMIIAQMRGGSVEGTAADLTLGTGSFAQMSVLRASDDLKFSWCLCTAHKTVGAHTAVPFADLSVNPTSRVCSGTNVFDLYLGLFSGTTYTFNSTAFNYYAIVWPVFT